MSEILGWTYGAAHWCLEHPPDVVKGEEGDRIDVVTVLPLRTCIACGTILGLADLEYRAKKTLEGKSRSYVDDAKVFAQVVLLFRPKKEER